VDTSNASFVSKWQKTISEKDTAFQCSLPLPQKVIQVKEDHTSEEEVFAVPQSQTHCRIHNLCNGKSFHKVAAYSLYLHIYASWQRGKYIS
jgi:hypothetical protein